MSKNFVHLKIHQLIVLVLKYHVFTNIYTDYIKTTFDTMYQKKFLINLIF